MVLPNINVWLALTLKAHVHHDVAWNWYKSVPLRDELFFCRSTQLGLLRLLTTKSVAKQETLNQLDAWGAYDRWIDQGGAAFQEEPSGLEIEFRSFADRRCSFAARVRGFLFAAFAAASSMELVTFDRALSMRAKRSMLLKSFAS